MASHYVFHDPSYADGAYRKHPEDVRVLELDWLPVVANYWEPGKQYSSLDTVRPVSPTGFAYRAGGAGQSAFRTPRWPEALAGTVIDGAITWTAVAASGNGVVEVANESAEIDPTGDLTVSDVEVVEETRIRLKLTGGVIDGGDDHTGRNGATVRGYLLTVTVTAGDETLKGSLIVAVVPR